MKLEGGVRSCQLVCPLTSVFYLAEKKYLPEDFQRFEKKDGNDDFTPLNDIAAGLSGKYNLLPLNEFKEVLIME